MGIKVEFNPDLALRDCNTTGRLEQECIPAKMELGATYEFLKKGQRNYWLEGEIPLLITRGDEVLSRPIASITIEECTHFKRNGEIYSRGKYKVVAIFDPDSNEINFEGYQRKCTRI